MGIGDPAIPVSSAEEINSPIPQDETNQQKRLDIRLTVVERADTNTEQDRQIKWLYDNLPGGPYPYPPP